MMTAARFAVGFVIAIGLQTICEEGMRRGAAIILATAVAHAFMERAFRAPMTLILAAWRLPALIVKAGL